MSERPSLATLTEISLPSLCVHYHLCPQFKAVLFSCAGNWESKGPLCLGLGVQALPSSAVAVDSAPRLSPALASSSPLYSPPARLPLSPSAGPKTLPGLPSPQVVSGFSLSWWSRLCPGWCQGGTVLEKQCFPHSIPFVLEVQRGQALTGQGHTAASCQAGLLTSNLGFLGFVLKGFETCPYTFLADRRLGHGLCRVPWLVYHLPE